MTTTEETTITPSQPVKGKHYFSKAQNLYITFRAAKKELIDGELHQVGHLAAQFSPDGAGFGRFYTENKELIECLDEHIAKVGDIFGPAEYQKRIVPADKRAEMLERELSTANDLIKKLQNEGKLKK